MAGKACAVFEKFRRWWFYYTVQAAGYRKRLL
jgi:hypothetical protein